MSSSITNKDSRSMKTKKALHAAMFSLLKKHNFKKITVKEVCEEALVSRATFYTHFIDKYDLLKHWMAELWPKEFDGTTAYEQVENAVNSYIYENIPVLNNLVDDADDETFDILFDFILSTINLSVEINDSKELSSKNIVLSNFYAGGIMSYLSWQVKNKFPPDIPPMNIYLYGIIQELRDWQSK